MCLLILVLLLRGTTLSPDRGRLVIVLIFSILVLLGYHIKKKFAFISTNIYITWEELNNQALNCGTAKFTDVVLDTTTDYSLIQC